MQIPNGAATQEVASVNAHKRRRRVSCFRDVAPFASLWRTTLWIESSLEDLPRGQMNNAFIMNRRSSVLAGQSRAYGACKV